VIHRRTKADARCCITKLRPLLKTCLEVFSGLTFGLIRTRDFFVVLLQGSQIFTGFRELTLLHTFTDVPVNEGALGVHQVELGVDAGKDGAESGGVGQHANRSVDLGEITTRNNDGGLAVNTALETSGGPVNELNRVLALDGVDGRADVTGDYVTTVHQAASHVLARARIALAEHVLRVEDGAGDLRDAHGFHVGLLGRDDRSHRAQQEVDTRIRNQVSLELVDVNVERALEAQRGSQGGHNLSNQSVQVGVRGAGDVQRALANVVDGLVVEHEGAISVFQESVSGQDGVVGLNDGSAHLRRGVDAEIELGLLAKVDGESLQQQGGKSGAGTTTNGVHHEETLETVATLSNLADAFQSNVDVFLANGVVTTSVVVGSIFLALDQVLRVEQVLVSSTAEVVDDVGLQIGKDSTRDVPKGDRS
jgi:hypothetical protein